MDSSCVAAPPSPAPLSTAPGTCSLLQMDRARHTRPCRAGTQMLASRSPARQRFGEMACCYCMGKGRRGGSTEAGEPPCLPWLWHLSLFPSQFHGGSRCAASGGHLSSLLPVDLIALIWAQLWPPPLEPGSGLTGTKGFAVGYAEQHAGA